MLDTNKEIDMYGQDIDDIIKLSPFESTYLLHIRSQIERELHTLTNEEKIKLYSYDLKLIKNAKELANHIKEIYDFKLSKEPLQEWWWHLDRVASGEITFTLTSIFKDE
ncbi:hypothetical protein [Bacillus sp. RS11]|uniref:hypothetical protein n=1 Tax=Lysinibacillus sp. RS11 TaxID=3242682 RepID=UPI0035C767AF